MHTHIHNFEFKVVENTLKRLENTSNQDAGGLQDDFMFNFYISIFHIHIIIAEKRERGLPPLTHWNLV